MKKKNKKWLKKFLMCSFTIILILCSTAYVLDPQDYFRINKENRMLNASFADIGLIKNYDYNTIVIGSSMTENFDLDYINNKLNTKSLKVNIGAMTLYEMAYFMNETSTENGNTDFIVGMDLGNFRNIYKEELRDYFPTYMYDDDKFNDIKYLLSYESWLRFLPINFLTNICIQHNLLPNSIANKINRQYKIKNLGSWDKDSVFGEKVVLKNYNSKKNSTSIVERANFQKNYKKTIDSFFDSIDGNLQNKKQETVFFFPPYSALFWTNAKKENIDDLYWTAKKYFVEKASVYKNVRVVDMQDYNKITDLNHYKDTVHYDLVIQNKIVDFIQNKQMDINVNNFNEKKENWEKQISIFQDKYKGKY